VFRSLNFAPPSIVFSQSVIGRAGEGFAMAMFFARAQQGGAERRFVAFAGRLRVEPGGLECVRRGNV
jgi:hypothetical protein